MTTMDFRDHVELFVLACLVIAFIIIPFVRSVLNAWCANTGKELPRPIQALHRITNLFQD